MSLSKIIPLSKMDALQKNAYVSHKSKELVSAPEDMYDEKLTKYNLNSIRLLNDYLEKSKEVLYAMLVLSCLLKDDRENWNVVNLVKSLTKQRNLAKLMKVKLKHIGISKDWFAIVEHSYNRLIQRVDYIEHIAIRNVAETTELDIYMKELEIRGVSFIEDMEARIATNSNLNDVMQSDNWKEEISDYVEYVKGSIYREIVPQEMRQEYLAKKAIKQEFTAKKHAKTLLEKEERKNEAYKEMCEMLERDVFSMHKRFVNAYRYSKKATKMMHAIHLLSNCESVAVFLCKRQYSNSFGREMFLTKYKNEIVLTENIDRLIFVPIEDVDDLEKKLQKKRIAYAVCFFTYNDICSIIREIERD